MENAWAYLAELLRAVAARWARRKLEEESVHLRNRTRHDIRRKHGHDAVTNRKRADR